MKLLPAILVMAFTFGCAKDFDSREPLTYESNSWTKKFTQNHERVNIVQTIDYLSGNFFENSGSTFRFTYKLGFRGFL